MKLNLGCGEDILNPEEWINMDKNSTDSRVFQLDMEHIARVMLTPYSFTGFPVNPDKNVFDNLKNIEYVKAHHCLEHVYDLDLIMQWLHQICVDGATIDIVVPLAGTLWGVANPDHKRQFNHYTFMYYCKEFKTSDLGLFTGYSMKDQRLEDVGIHKFGGLDFQVGNLHTWLTVNK